VNYGSGRVPGEKQAKKTTIFKWFCELKEILEGPVHLTGDNATASP
jgi:hypothetical protein